MKSFVTPFAVALTMAALFGTLEVAAADRAEQVESTQRSARAAAGQSPAPSAARGRQLYLSVGCVHCHGTQGQGSTAGARLAPEPLPAAAIAQFIRATNTTMPAYSEKVLGDADVADIAAFLASLPAPKPVERIPALRDLEGPRG
jgi:mono/diheme cytochrome c family protein